MAGLALSGLASGVDTSGIVDQLMALERRSITRLQYRQAAYRGQQDALKDVASKLAALKDAALALRSDATWSQSQAVESSDPARVAVARTGGAGIGGHAIQVDRLASSMQRGYAFDGASGGTITIAYASGEPDQSISITVEAGASLKSVADGINARANGPVGAAIVKDAAGEERLVLSSRKTGSSSDFTVTAAGVLTEVEAYRTPNVADLDAAYSIDGVAATSQTNVLENAIAGLRITLKGVTTAPASVTVGAPEPDREGIKKKVKAFVDAYNAVVTTTRAKLSEKPIANPTSTAQAGLGRLYGDSALSGMLSSLRTQMTRIVDGAGVNDLGDLGVAVPKSTGGSTSEDAKAGRLVLDGEKLAEAIDADWTAVKDFFGGFAAEVETFVRAQTGGSGLIDGRLKSSELSLKGLQGQIDRTNERLDLKENRLRAQFAAMELALQNSQTQQSWLAGQLAALDRQIP